MKYWITKSSDPSSDVYLWRSETPPKWRDDIETYVQAGYANYLTAFCVRDWNKVTGVTLKPGEIKQIKITVEVVE